MTVIAAFHTTPCSGSDQVAAAIQVGLGTPERVAAASSTPFQERASMRVLCLKDNPTHVWASVRNPAVPLNRL